MKARLLRAIAQHYRGRGGGEEEGGSFLEAVGLVDMGLGGTAGLVWLRPFMPVWTC